MVLPSEEDSTPSLRLQKNYHRPVVGTMNPSIQASLAVGCMEADRLLDDTKKIVTRDKATWWLS